METWKSLPGFPMYAVSDLGRIRKETNERCLRPKINQYGVVGVGLMRNGLQCHRSVPLLVAEAWIEKPMLTFDTPINLDGNRYNNKVSNLMWRPRWFAREYNKQFKEPYEYPILTPVYDLELGEDVIFANSFECAINFGLLERDIVLSIANRTYAWPTYQLFAIL